MNPKIKRFTMVAIAVGLVCVLLVGSALALNVSHQKVSMPDPYGVMPLSLNPDDATRTVKTSGTYKYGANSPTSYRRSVSAFTDTIDSTAFDGDPDGWYSPGTSTSKGTYLQVPSGFYVDITAPASFPNTEYGSVIFSGGGSFSIQNSPWASSFVDVYAYPNTVQILVNGVLVGDPITCTSSGGFTLPDIEVTLTDTVTSIGLRFTWTSADTVYNTTGSLASMTYRSYFRFTDTTSVTPVDIADIDYIPYFNRVIAWLQSVFGAVSPLNDSLLRIEDSLSALGGDGGIQAVVSALTGTNGTVANFTEDLKTIFAGDGDLQLKEDSAPIASAATDAFYNPESSTAITTEKVSDAQTALQGAGAMFDSGYEVGDIFTDISENSADYMSWFTSEAAGWLDTVPATASDPDDPDPFNHHYIENQYAAIKKARGEGD